MSLAIFRQGITKPHQEAKRKSLVWFDNEHAAAVTARW
jgi:hypothetical protein